LGDSEANQKSVLFTARQMIIMPAKIPHAVLAKKRFKMILTMIHE
jgi:hypothetical protein